MDTKILKAEKRKVVGRKVKVLRGQGILPANIFGKKIKSTSVQVKIDEFKKIYNEVGETGVLSLEVAGEKAARPVLVTKIQKDPVSDALMHVDFHQVDLKEKVEAKVPVELVGESPAEKQGIGTVVLYLNEIDVEALPTDLPEKFAVDTSSLTEVDQAVFVKDLKIDKAKVMVKTDPESILVKVEPPQKEEVVAPPPVAEGEAVVSEAGEGEVSAEGLTPTGAETPAGKPSEETTKKEVKPQASEK
jgi:large subunit ribosomal protein L25